MRKRYALALLGFISSVPAFAAGVAPGTSITNTANVSYTVSGVSHTGSASSAFVVDQLVDNTTTWQDAGAVAVSAGASNQGLLFKLTNTGNGSDTFGVVATPSPGTSPSFTPANCRIYFDTDNNGVYSAADTLYVPGSNDPVLAADASVKVLAVCDIPVTAADQSQGGVKLVTTSKTVSGAPGTVNIGGGVGGVDAIAGTSGGAASATGTYKAGNVDYTLTMAQAVTDPSGGAQAVSGATIEYTMTIKPNGSATGTNLVITDPIPVSTTYVPGSLTLNGTPLGDSASDGDAGDYNVTNTNAITVTLGNLSGSGATQVVTFQVKIN
ncbi:MAG: hypothetical protein ACRETO_04035 [Gammaproteobacteria bacterium]